MNCHYVFADRLTGKIRGWALIRTEDHARLDVREGEVFTSVARKPDLEVDRYVDFATGEMSSEPFNKAI